MENNSQWIPVEKLLPTLNTDVLILYNHKPKTSWRGKSGTFMTQGKLATSWGSTTKLEWEDYLGRAIESLSAKASNNKVTHWQPLLVKP